LSCCRWDRVVGVPEREINHYLVRNAVRSSARFENASLCDEHRLSGVWNGAESCAFCQPTVRILGQNHGCGRTADRAPVEFNYRALRISDDLRLDGRLVSNYAAGKQQNAPEQQNSHFARLYKYLQH
jgi:hypothetical protein